MTRGHGTAFRNAADRVTLVEANGRGNGPLPLGMEGGKYSQWITQNSSGMILDDMRNPSECRLDSPESIAAVERILRGHDGQQLRHAPGPTSAEAGGDIRRLPEAARWP
ncbi:MAG: hypothetical protein R2856_03270 [Caldilineaceae bacterium]